VTIAQPTSADLRLTESASLVEGGVQPDGSVLLNLIRPCVGRGRGRHLYKPEMLEANAGKFSGWKMYLNHLSESARRALGGLPRDIREVGGIIDESWWDPSVPAHGRFGQGAVVGRSKPVQVIRDLVEVDPRLVECSISATATGVSRARVGNEDVWVVEGISNDPKGSVDWVTDGGAGGQVASMMESVYEAADPVQEYLSTLSYQELERMLVSPVGELAEAFAKKKADAGDDGDGDDQLAALVKKFMDRGMPEAAAKKAAQRAMSAKEYPTTKETKWPN
jgi:hypothetical protein